ncbi:MAG: DUF433 domain-containing protein, partial [Mariniphaga sp.]
MQDWKNHIEVVPEIMYGKPVIRGTRIPVDIILEKMSNGQTNQEIIRNYPDLNEEDLLACLSFVTSLLRKELIIPLSR